jgi:hypothetical protein
MTNIMSGVAVDMGRSGFMAQTADSSDEHLFVQASPVVKLDKRATPEDFRRALATAFYQLAQPLIGKLDETQNRDFHRLISFINSNLKVFKAVFHSPANPAEQQVARWLRDIATLPKSCSMRQQAAPLPVLFGLIPRGFGEPILQEAKDEDSLR